LILFPPDNGRILYWWSLISMFFFWQGEIYVIGQHAGTADHPGSTLQLRFHLITPIIKIIATCFTTWEVNRVDT
jgi:hypothetical protein